MERRDGIFIAQRIDTVCAGVNGFYFPASVPFGGVKASGLGREHGPEGYDCFLGHISNNVSADLAARLADRYPDG